ncbi:hypothetical protein ACFSQ7_19365 [Paenibacillus rhizoplanae]
MDGDHSYGGVSSDYHMYRQLVSQGGIIAFHDIHLHPKTWGRGYDVGIYWNEVKLLCSTCTEISDPEGAGNRRASSRMEGPYPTGLELFTINGMRRKLS